MGCADNTDAGKNQGKFADVIIEFSLNNISKQLFLFLPREPPSQRMPPRTGMTGQGGLPTLSRRCWRGRCGR